MFRNACSLRSLVTVGLAAAITALFTGCGSPPSSESASHTSITIGVSPTVLLNWWPTIVSASACYSTGGGILGPYMYWPLLTLAQNGTINYHTSIASSISVSGHDRIYTVHLKPSWHWSDGTPVTAADVVYDFVLSKASSQSSAPFLNCFAGFGGMPNDWQSVTAPNRHTVVIKTTHPINPEWFITNGIGSLTPMPAHVWKKYANPMRELAWIKSIADSPLNPVYRVVDGPYRLASYKQDQYWKFVVNPHFSGTPKPTISTIVYDYEPSDAAMMAGLEKGSLDIAAVTSGLSFTDYTALQHLKGYRVLAEPQMTVVQLKPNEHSQSPLGTLFQHTYVRQALQLGIDGAGIVKGIYYGDGTVPGGPIPSTPHTLFYDSHLKLPLPFDLARGKKLLENHGWVERNGVMTKSGRRFAFTLLYPTGNPSQVNELEIVQADWAKEGIKVTLRGLGASSFGATIYGPPSGWDMALSEWTYLPDYDPDGSPLYLPGGPDNIMGYSNAEMTALIAATDGPASPSGTRAAFAAYQAYASDQVPELYLPTPDVLYAVRNTIQGFAAAYNPWLLVPNDNELTLKTSP